MLPALALASSAVSAAGSVMGGMRANAQGKHSSSIAKQNAALSDEASRDSVRRGQDERHQFWRDVGRTKGQQRASMAANGIEVDDLAGARMQEDTAMLAAEDAARLNKNIEQRTRGFQIQAWNERAQGKAARAQGKSALTGSLFSAAGTLMGGASQAAQMNFKPGSARG